GKKIIPGLQDATTQDFLLIRTPTVPFRSPEEFVNFQVANEKPALLLPRAIAGVGFVRTMQILRAVLPGLIAPIASFATTRYFSALPIRWGAYAARFDLLPRAPSNGKPEKKTADYLGDEIAARLGAGAIE